MLFFKKKKTDDYEYMDDDFFDNYQEYNNYEQQMYGYYQEERQQGYQTPMQQSNFNNYAYNQPYQDNIDKKEIKNNKKALKHREKLLRKFQTGNKKKSNKKTYYDDYNDEIYGYKINMNEFSDVEYYNEGGKSGAKVWVIVLVILYMGFITLGVVNTTFESGYKPQVISYKIKSQRVMYDKCINKIEKIDDLDTFQGISEIQEVLENKNYQERIPPLKNSLDKVSKELENLKSSAFKLKQNDYLNIEMLDMVKDLYNTQSTVLTKAIRFYESLSGHSGNIDAISTQRDELISEYTIYKNKYANYQLRFEQIRIESLKLGI